MSAVSPVMAQSVDQASQRVPRPSASRMLASGILLALFAFGIWGIVQLEINWQTLSSSTVAAERVMSTMGPISLPAWRDLLYLIGLTIGIVVLGTGLAALLSLPLAVCAADNTAPAPWLRAPARAIGVLCRAIPDVVLALAFSLAFALGSAVPGILAIGIHSVGMISKMFADAIEQVDRGPQLALRATGATRSQQFWSGVFPQVLPSWVATCLHRFDINLRGSAILGYAGVGGLGYAMRLAFQDFPHGYGRGVGIAGVIFVLCIVLEVISSALRVRLQRGPLTRTRRAGAGATAQPASVSVDEMMRRPWTRERVATNAWGLAAVLVVLASWLMADVHVEDMSLDMLAKVLRSFWPATTGAHSMAEFGEALLATLQIAAAATVVSLVFSLLIGSLAARNVAPGPKVRYLARVLLVVFRGVPELVLAIFLIMITGLGAQAGVIALGFGGIGLLGKLVADGLEEVDRGPEMALTALGASRVQRFASATWPMGLPSVVGSSLYLFDTNIRSATLLGIVGAGGVGFYLTNASTVLSLHGQVTMLVAMIVATVLLVEGLAAWMRHVLR